MASSSSSAPAVSELAVEQQAHEIYTTTMSPYCPGLLLSDCPSGKASDLKVEIQHWLESGQNSDQIRSQLQQRYKTSLDARPPAAGFGSLMWIVPALLLFVGAIVVVRWLQAQVRANK